MTRPRKASDPELWPIPCARCDEHHRIAANWPDGGICVYCYQQAKRTRGTCRCGHAGVLPGRIDGHPACRRCSDVRVNVDCRSCGTEDDLYSGGSCWTCSLGRAVDRALTDPTTGSVSRELAPLAQGLKSMKRANSGLTWIRQPHVTAFLQQLAAKQVVAHDVIDALPKSNTREFIRGLLIEHGVLPRRDVFKALYADWSTTTLDRLTDPTHRDTVQRYIRWQHQRRMNQMDEVSRATFLRSQQTVTVAIDLLNWLTEQRIDLGALDQEHLGPWLSTGLTDRLLADRFLAWAAEAQLVQPGLTLQPLRRRATPRLSAPEHARAIQRFFDNDRLKPRDRAAAVLMLAFGQQIDDIVDLTWDEISVTDELVTVRIGSIEIPLSEPLDGPWRALAAHPANAQTAAHPNSPWVFPGQSPGQHINARHLHVRLRRLLGLTDFGELAAAFVDAAESAASARAQVHAQEGDVSFRHSS